MKLNTVFDRILDVMAFVAGVLLIFSAFSVCAVILSRYFLNRPMGWMFEINEYILLFMAFLLAAWVLRKEGHVKMDVIIENVPPKIRFVCDVAGSVLGAVVCLVLTWFGMKVTWHLFQNGTLTTTYLRLPKYPFMFVIPFGSFMFMIQFIRRAYGFIRAGVVPKGKGLTPSPES